MKFFFKIQIDHQKKELSHLPIRAPVFKTLELLMDFLKIIS